MRFAGTLLPQLKDPKDDTETKKAVLDLLGKVNTVNSDLESVESRLTTAEGEIDAIQANYQLQSFKNTIINGDFDIWQRGTSFAAANSYTADRWIFAAGGGGVATVQRSTDAPDSQSLYSLQVDVTTADASIAAGDLALLYYSGVEGYDARKLIGKPFTVSFWVKSPKTGVHCVSLRNSGVDRSYVKEYTVNTANTWEYKSVTIQGGLITAGTWDWTNGRGFSLFFTLAMGSTYQTAPNAWQTGNYFATANQVNCMDNTANNFYLSRVQLELGETATEFEHRPIGVELELCQRYYIYMDKPRLRGVFYTGSPQAARAGLMLPTTMRIPPLGAISGTLDVYDGSNTGTVTGYITRYSTVDSVEFDCGIASGSFTGGRPAIFYIGVNSGGISIDADF